MAFADHGDMSQIENCEDCGRSLNRQKKLVEVILAVRFVVCKWCAADRAQDRRNAETAREHA